MRRGWIVAWVALVGLFACGDEENAVGTLGMACASDNDCALEPTPLFCVGVGSGPGTKMCTVSCSTDADCGVFGDASIACVEGEQKCMFTCDDGTRCPFGGQCVAPNKCFP